MTQWVENPTGGRDRGPVALAQAWVEVLVRPRRFFRAAVAPGDQAPGLVFAALVVSVEEATRFLLVENAYPVLGGQPALSFVFALALAALLVAPAALHLTAAVQTLILIPFAPERGGVSETVQLLAYSAAPCVFAGLPIPELRVACTAYGAFLLILGVHRVHRVSMPRAAVLGAIPAAIIFGFGFRGFAALETVLLGIV
ncbi:MULTISPECIES: YIP1 family protein [unclassified Haladaptatus]|uniref:YIP1 family protein n=1 Tax=unclassified Haladaptatus TaxID=2622732 RepID=UPI0023E898B9|nr:MULTISPECIES: YIP1 family protein [unclassified Haladaptatus]